MAPSPLEYLRRAFVALFNLQKHFLPSRVLDFKTSLANTPAVIMTATKEATVLICFDMNGSKMEMTGRAFIIEEFVRGMEKPFMRITLEKPTIEEVEPPPEIIIIEDSSEEDLKTTGGSPMMIDGESKQGMKRRREADSDDENPLVFRHMKKTRIGTILETSEDLEDPTGGLYEDVQRGNRNGEGPSDPYAEIWEEIWDEELARTFWEHN